MIWAFCIEVLFGAGLTWFLYWLSQYPRAGEFVFNGVPAPKVVAEQVTLSTDHRGLV